MGLNIQVRDLNPQSGNHTPIPKLEILLFDGSRPKWWIRRCEHFFQYYNVAKPQRITLATTYLNDTVDSWFQGWLRSKVIGVRWIDFAEEMCKRFGKKNMADVIEEFNKLK